MNRLPAILCLVGDQQELIGAGADVLDPTSALTGAIRLWPGEGIARFLCRAADAHVRLTDAIAGLDALQSSRPSGEAPAAARVPRQRAEQDALIARCHEDPRFRWVHEGFLAEPRCPAGGGSAVVFRWNARVRTSRPPDGIEIGLSGQRPISTRCSASSTSARTVTTVDGVWREARVRDLTLQRFQKDDLRQEMKSMDELARIRFAMPDSWRTET